MPQRQQFKNRHNHQPQHCYQTLPSKVILLIMSTTLHTWEAICSISSANIDAEIQYRRKCACAAYGRLKGRVFIERRIRISTKIPVCKLVAQPTRLYGSETWATCRRHIKTLEQFQQGTLRAILGVCWQQYP